MSQNHSERGAVSLLSVVFFMALISVITIGFARIMVQEQRQAIDNSLTAAALNAAEAGVEDAKRALLDYVKNGESRYEDAFKERGCPGYLQDTSIQERLGVTYDTDAGGVLVSSNDEANYEQYYTCVIVSPNSDDYIRNISSAYQSIVVPLDGTSAFDSFKFSWHTSDDGVPNRYYEGESSSDLPKEPELLGDEDDPKTPAYMRLQLITVDDADNITISELNKDSRTLFLNPKKALNNNNLNNSTNILTHDAIRVDPDDPKPVATKSVKPLDCWNPDLDEEPMPAYACKIKVNIEGLVGRIGSGKLAFLRITPIYSGAHIRIQLYDDETLVPFELVQPVVDSTGRANDVFRRVEARIELGSTDIISTNALEIGEGICKDFLVTSQPEHFSGQTFCENP